MDIYYRNIFIIYITYIIYTNIYVLSYIYVTEVYYRKKEHTENYILDIELKFSATPIWRDWNAKLIN